MLLPYVKPATSTTRTVRRVYLRISVTNRCNLRCQYCRPAHAESFTRSEALTSDEEYVALAEAIHDVRPLYKIRVTGGEPLLHKTVPELVGGLRQKFPDVHLCITTNGIFLNRYAKPLYDAGLDSLNISIDSVNPTAFRHITRGGDVNVVQQGIDAAKSAGFKQIKLNAVLMKSLNGNGLVDLVEYAARQGCEIRFIELMPLGQGAGMFQRDYFSSQEALDILLSRFDYMEKLPQGPTSQRHFLSGPAGEVVVGFIPTTSEPFCDRCDRLRLDAKGRLYHCLKSVDGPDCLTLLREGNREQLMESIRQTIAQKQTPEPLWPLRNMVHIGG